MDQLSTGVPVMIHLETHIKQDDNVSDYQLDVDGQLVQMGQNLYLRYLEPNDETGEKTGIQFAAWNPLHSIMLNKIHCIQ